MPNTGKRCRHGHDWRVSFDGRFSYCFNCPAKWHSRDGRTPPQENYKVYPGMPEWTQQTSNQQGATTVPNIPEVFDVLGDDFNENDQQTSGEPQWCNVEDVLYQEIIITRANVADKFDSYSGKNKAYAYVNFYYAEDEAQTPWVFRTGWQKIKKQVAAFEQLKADGNNPYPIECGVAEILIDNPFVPDDGVARFPLHFVPFGVLDEMQAASVDFQVARNQSSSAPQATAAPTPPPAQATAPTAPGASARRSAPTAGGSSARTGVKPNGSRS